MKKRSAILYIICLVFAVCVFGFAGAQIWQQLAEQARAEEQKTLLADQMVTVRQPEKPEVVAGTQPAPEAEDAVPEQAPLQVDFPALLAKNKHVVAWIYSEGTPINYPVVRTENNTDYLRRLLDGSYNRAGTIFADYRNHSDFSDWNTLVYGHNMKNDTMFGTLPCYKESGYYESHPVLWLLTPEQDYKVELVAGYSTRADATIYALAKDAQERDLQLTAARELSDFQSAVEVGPEDKLVTLSTCTYDRKDGRYVVIGVLRPVKKTET